MNSLMQTFYIAVTRNYPD